MIVSNKNCGARGRSLHRASWRCELTASWGITERIVEKPRRVTTVAKPGPESITYSEQGGDLTVCVVIAQQFSFNKSCET